MNLTLDETQNDLAGLAAQIFAGRGKPEQLEQIEATDDRFDRDLWRELAEAGLLGVAIPGGAGGLGFGSVELGLVCEQLGRVVAPIPLVGTTCAAQLIAAVGTPEQQDDAGCRGRRRLRRSSPSRRRSRCQPRCRATATRSAVRSSGSPGPTSPTRC